MHRTAAGAGEPRRRVAAMYHAERILGVQAGFAGEDSASVIDIGSRGGIPLVEGNKIVGAIGCSGGTGSQDEVACKAGAAPLK